MNCARFIICLYFFIIMMGADLAVSLPILNQIKYGFNVQIFNQSDLSKTRFARQVVQPKWLTFGQESSIDPKVHINQKSLREAAAIRRTIQKAKEDNINIDFNEKKILKSVVDIITVPPLRETKTKDPMYAVSNWYIHMLKLKQKLAANFSSFFRN